jgi:hypothetical protein
VSRDCVYHFGNCNARRTNDRRTAAAGWVGHAGYNGYVNASAPEPELDDLYRELILDHYRRPHNRGKLEGATHAEGYNPLCGAEIDVFIEALQAAGKYFARTEAPVIR